MVAASDIRISKMNGNNISFMDFTGKIASTTYYRFKWLKQQGKTIKTRMNRIGQFQD